MKRFRKIAIVALSLICVLCAVFAFGCSDSTTYYTVTFMDGQTQVGESVKVKKGGKITEYPTAARSDPDDVFDGWFKDDGLTKAWDHDIERVTKDITLWANFLHVSATPNNVAMTDTAFSNTVSWLQRGITEESNFVVEISGTDIVSGGKEEFTFESYKGHIDILAVKWTPATKPLGGTYSVEISDDNAAKVTVDNLIFKGAGEEQNPYLLYSGTDLAAVNTTDVSGGCYKLAQSFTAKSSSDSVAGKTFNGKLDGNGKSITLEASDYGLFGILGTNAEVKDLTVAGAVGNVQTNCVGAIAGVNRGEISYCTVSATLDSAMGSVGTLDGDKDGIDGGIAGIAGINYGGISCCNYTSGTIKANAGGAGIAVINNGTVSLCSFTGTIGAGNSNETGNSTKAYSYLGGIVSINYATVEKSSIDGSGKILAQRGEGGLNDYVGGIVALNQTDATVKECWFDGIRVHGNKNVGGIAGANAGTVTHCYAGGDYHSGSKNHSYVGGLSEVGGITGLSSGGTVTNCFVTSNIYAYSGNAYKVAQNAVNSVYIGGNLDVRSGTVNVKADENNGNIKIDLSDDFSAKNYPLVLTDGQLAALNGGIQAFVNKDEVCLACESESTEIEHFITVKIDGSEIGTVSSVSGNKISLKEHTPAEVPENHYFAGWAVVDGGEAVFAQNAEMDYAALANYGDGNVTLYPVYKEGEKPQSKVLNVAVYARYVNEDIVKELLKKFEESELFAGFESTGYTLVGTDKSNNEAFQAGVAAGNEYGAYNVAIGFRNALDVGQSKTIDVWILSKDGKKLESRQVGIIGGDNVVLKFAEFLDTDVAKKVMYPDYVSESEAHKIEITLMNGATQHGEKLIVSDATDAKNITLPALEAEEGFTFAGWALAETASDGETLLNGEKSYKDLENLATNNALTLYARFTQNTGDDKTVLTVGYWTYGGVVTSEVAQNLLTEFENYAKENELDFTIVFREYDVATYAKVADLVNKVTADNDVDYILGIGKSSGELQFVSGTKVQVGTRYVAQLTDSDDAKALHAYFTQSAILKAA